MHSWEGWCSRQEVVRLEKVVEGGGGIDVLVRPERRCRDTKSTDIRIAGQTEPD